MECQKKKKWNVPRFPPLRRLASPSLITYPLELQGPVQSCLLLSVLPEAPALQAELELAAPSQGFPSWRLSQ